MIQALELIELNHAVRMLFSDKHTKSLSGARMPSTPMDRAGGYDRNSRLPGSTSRLRTPLLASSALHSKEHRPEASTTETDHLTMLGLQVQDQDVGRAGFF